MKHKGIYILATVGEYRIFVGNITNMYSEFDTNGRFVFDPSVVYQFYSKSPVYDNKECALKAAMSLSQVTGEVDDGICWIRDIESKSFSDFVSGVK